MRIYFFDVFEKTIFGVFIAITSLCLGFTCMLDKWFNTDHNVSWYGMAYHKAQMYSSRLMKG